MCYAREMAGFDQLSAMKVFVAIAREGSFAAASDYLGLTPPTVTKTIQKLEQHVGVPLLVRTTRRVGLTEAGYTYLNTATEMIARLDAVELQIREGGEYLTGKLRVTAPMALGRRVLSPLVAAFAVKHPRLALDWILTDRVTDPIEEDFDIALRTCYRLDNSPLYSQRICEINRVIVAHPDLIGKRSIGLTDLESLPAVIFLRDKPQTHWRFFRDGKYANVTVKGIYRTNNIHAVLDAVREGMGIANIPEYVASEDLKSGRLVQLVPKYKAMRHSLFAVYRQRLSQSRKLTAFFDFLSEQITMGGKI